MRKNIQIAIILAMLAFCTLLITPLNATIYYVKPGGDGNRDGRSWVNAESDLQDILEQVQAGDTVFVAKGTYIPGRHPSISFNSPIWSNFLSPRSNTFYLKTDGVTLLGGFPDTGEPGIAERNISSNPTILSGNAGDPSDDSDNLRHVFVVTGTLNNKYDSILIDGFIIEYGNATNPSSPTDVLTTCGGGMYIQKNQSPPPPFSSPPTWLVLRNMTFRNNRASQRGAAVFLGGTAKNLVVIEKSFFQDNTGNEGAAITLGQDMNDLIVNNCEFSNNSSVNIGGAISATGASTHTLVCTNTSFVENSTTSVIPSYGNGGAIYNDGSQSGSSFRFEDCVFRDNRSSQNGGAIFNRNTNISVTAKNIIRNCLFTGNTSLSSNGGGAIHCSDASIDSILFCEFRENRSENNGGAIYSNSLPGGDTLVIKNSSFVKNFGKSSAGAIYNMQKSTVLLYECLIDSNTSDNQGGGISNNIGGTLSVENSTISNNKGTFGGGIFNEMGKSVTVYSTKLVKNRAINGYGGGIHNFLSTLKCTDVSFEGNYSSSGGGGLDNQEAATATLERCNFSLNSAEFGGALTTWHNSKLYYYTGRVRGNYARGGVDGGGGIYSSNAGFWDNNNVNSASIVNVAITENFANNVGGGIYNETSKLKLVNVTIAGNNCLAPGAGSGIANTFGSVDTIDIHNTVIFGNRTDNADVAVNNIPANIIPSTPATPGGIKYSITNSLIGGKTNTANGNISYTGAVLSFMNAEGSSLLDFFDNFEANFPNLGIIADFRIYRNSYLRDKGNNVTFENAAREIIGFIPSEYKYEDAAEGPRLVNETIDIGAFENIYVVPDGNKIVYVDKKVRPGGKCNGESWEHAIPELSDALLGIMGIRKVNDNTDIDSIWVAESVYYPKYESDAMKLIGKDSRNNSFILFDSISIYGGFAPNRDDYTNPVANEISDAAPDLNKTILSGNIGDASDSTDNTVHVVIASNITKTLLNGFYIEDGYAANATALTVNGNTIDPEFGGGIYCDDVINFSAERLRFNNNHAKNSGGGLYIANGNINLDSSRFNNNGVANNGGGLYISNGLGNLANSCFNGNSAKNAGGAVYSNDMLYSQNSSYAGNMAVANGGAVNAGNGFSSIKDSFVENTANIGGGLYIANDIGSLDSSCFNNNSAENEGGAVYSSNKLYSRNSNYIGNTAVAAGGAVNAGNGFSSVQDSFVENTANIGGGLYIANDIAAFDSSYFNRNSADDAGGAVYSEKKLYSVKSIYSGNTAVTAGGAVNAGNGFSSTRDTFTGNTAGNGGACYVVLDTTKIFNSVFSHNTANKATSQGAALYVNNSKYWSIYRSEFLQNVSLGKGGAVYAENSRKGKFVNSRVAGNQANIDGGGIYISNADTNIFANTLISGNMAPAGGGMYVADGVNFYTNLTIGGNSLGLVPAVGFENSSGIYVEDGEHYFRNSVVWANDDTNRVQVAASGTTIKYYYSLLQNQDLSLSGNGNLNGTLPGNNPQFVDIGPVKTVFEGGNYRVYPTSNLINKGSNSYFDMGAIPDLSKDTFDLGGESRILQGNIDIGAYEFDGTYRLTISDKTITANEQQQHIDSVYLTINGIDLLDTRPFITYSYYLTGDDTTLLPELPVCPDTYMVVAVYSGGIYPDCTDTATLIIKQDPSPKSITFDPLPTKYLNYDPDFQLTATSSTEDIVKFTITGGDTACISLTDDGWVTMLDTGVVYISAYQVYNCSYLMPDTVERELIITKFHQEIIFVDAIEDHVLFVNGVNMNPPIRNLTAYADTSKLPITYRIVDGDPSIIDLTPNGRVTLFDTGTVFIRAEQAGNDIYYAAEPVICRLHISAVNASFDSITNVTGKVSFNPTDTVIYYTIPCDYTDNIMEFNFYTSSNAEIRSRDGEDYYPLVTDVSAPGQQSFYFELYVVPTDGTEPISVPYTFIIRKNYMFDDLVITKWDNTFIVNNKRAEEEFGLEPVGRNDQGGALYNYKWYIDGEVIEKYMDKSYYSAGDTKNDKLSTTSEYYLVLGTGDGREITTCPYRHPGTSSWEAFASSYPNPVSAGSTITVESNLYEAGSGSTYIDVYSIKGAKILTKDVTSEKTSIRMPSQKGLYVIVVRNSKNKKQISVVVQ